jgi:hypothetical protein
MGARGGALRSAGLRAPTPQRIATFLVGSRLKLTMVRKKQGTWSAPLSVDSVMLRF